jgi:16S rRNA (guanine527-N7)-methyltransferase
MLPEAYSPKALREVLENQDEVNARGFLNSEVDLFCRYYELILEWNPRLHLTTITSPQLFAEQHLIESAFAACYLHQSVRKVWDFGSGAGIPGIPLAILRPDLEIVLVESNRKKMVFLKEATDRLQLQKVRVLNTRFESIADVGSEDCVTCRAIERMKQTIKNILEVGWSARQFLLFGGIDLRSVTMDLIPPEITAEVMLLPNSNDRWLISLLRST